MGVLAWMRNGGTRIAQHAWTVKGRTLRVRCGLIGAIVHVTRYLLRRLLIAVPSLLGISVILFTVLALAPGDPFSELATNPNVPPEVAASLRAKFGRDDPVPLGSLHWLAAMFNGEWGFPFVSRVNVDTLILQRLPTTLFVIGSSQILALLIALPVGLTAATGAH